jgi:hypothetical protein
MSETFWYDVTTTLPRHLVWNLFTDISNWPSFTNMYRDLEWQGEPWVSGSAIVGELCYPVHMPFRYLIKRCEPPDLIGYLAHSDQAGLATERTVRFRPLPFGTLIEVKSSCVGEPPQGAGGSQEFIRSVHLSFFSNFARFCDEYLPGPSASQDAPPD